jgi:hypothetical protein
MSTRSIAVLASVLMLAACGGGTSPTATPAGASPSPAGTPVPGQAISGPQIQNAFTALETLDSYQYTGSYFTGYTGVGAPVTIVGTERQTPQYELDTKTSTTNQTDTEAINAQYIRIGNDIWVNSGNPDAFYHYDATDPSNGAILAQYEPFGLALQIAQSSGARLQYQPMGTETVNGVESTHYGLSQADRDNLIEASGLDPQSWAGDIWLATSGGWIVKGQFGPVMQGETEPVSGFRWAVVAINCTCPVTAPTNVAQ